MAATATVYYTVILEGGSFSSVFFICDKYMNDQCSDGGCKYSGNLVEMWDECGVSIVFSSALYVRRA